LRSKRGVIAASAYVWLRTIRTKQWVSSRVLERADAYYHVLWSALTATERLVLYRLRPAFRSAKILDQLQFAAHRFVLGVQEPPVIWRNSKPVIRLLLADSGNRDDLAGGEAQKLN
jgi:hypothetical protein